MLDEIVCDITYKIDGVDGEIILLKNADNFNKQLRITEQALADAKATDIVYTYRERQENDNVVFDAPVQLSNKYE